MAGRSIKWTWKLIGLRLYYRPYATYKFPPRIRGSILGTNGEIPACSSLPKLRPSTWRNILRLKSLRHIWSDRVGYDSRIRNHIHRKEPLLLLNILGWRIHDSHRDGSILRGHFGGEQWSRPAAGLVSTSWSQINLRCIQLQSETYVRVCWLTPVGWHLRPQIWVEFTRWIRCINHLYRHKMPISLRWGVKV